MFPRLAVLIVAVLIQSRPTGGPIAQFVPPVPTPASFVSDERNVLTPAGHQALDARIREVQAAGRGDIAVAILPSIGDYSPTQIGVEIYRTWKVGAQAEIGSARRHLGVLILVVPKELSPNNRGECWITTGLGAEAMITDAFAGAVCRDRMIPFLRDRKYDEALLAGVKAIDTRLSSSADLQDAPPPEAESKMPVRLGIGFGAGFIALIFGLIFKRWLRRRPRRCKQCHAWMRRLDESDDDARLAEGQVAEEKVRSVDYDVWECREGHFVIVAYKKWFTEYSRCRECKRITAKAKRKVLRRATTVLAGRAQDTYTCRNCKAEWLQEVTLPILTDSSSSGSSGGGGGGGGSSFGGSGSSSGGGGGSSY
jgi:uncharacterized protein